jgi:hypothetical protein
VGPRGIAARVPFVSPCVRDYAETPIAPAPHPRRTRSGTGRGTGRDRRISREFRECAASSGNGRPGSPRLVWCRWWGRRSRPVIVRFFGESSMSSDCSRAGATVAGDGGVKALVDQNLFFRLLAVLVPRFPDICHVRDVGFTGDDDDRSWPSFTKPSGMRCRGRRSAPQ